MSRRCWGLDGQSGLGSNHLTLSLYNLLTLKGIDITSSLVMYSRRLIGLKCYLAHAVIA